MIGFKDRAATFLAKENAPFHLMCVIFLVIAVSCLGRYFLYLGGVASFPFDWMPSDGDHLNFAHRIMQGLHVYPDLNAGEVLSIYNPLYYMIIGLFGGADVGMLFARSASLLFWLACPLLVTIYYSKRWGWLYAVLAAIFILLPAEPYMLLDIVSVTPDSSMAFFFVCTMLAAETVLKKEEAFKWELLLVGGLAALCFLSKQQGVIAIVSVVAFAIVSRKSIKSVSLLTAGFLAPFLLSVVYFEIVNSGQFLQDTLFALDKVMVVTPGLAGDRFLDFLMHHLAFTLCVVAAFILVAARLTKLSIWHVTFILHILLLLKTLGNGGGGPNYFVTFWVTTVVISISAIVIFDRRATKLHLFHRMTRIKWDVPLLSRVLLVCLFINVAIGTIGTHTQINSITSPSENLEVIMQEYYDATGLLVAGTPNARVLTNRNIGALVVNRVNVTNEGSTMFQYAWAHPEFFDQNIILDAIAQKKYDFIFTGLQPYPANVMRRIEEAYKVAMINEQVVYMGNIGLVKVYVPK